MPSSLRGVTSGLGTCFVSRGLSVELLVRLAFGPSCGTWGAAPRVLAASSSTSTSDVVGKRADSSRVEEGPGVFGGAASLGTGVLGGAASFGIGIVGGAASFSTGVVCGAVSLGTGVVDDAACLRGGAGGFG